MDEKKAYICPQCGGTINRAKMICEYCGTRFREEHNEVKVVAYNPHVQVLKASVSIPREMIYRSPKEAAEYAIEKMSAEFAAGIAKNIEVRTTERPGDQYVVFSSRLRVIESGYMGVLPQK